MRERRLGKDEKREVTPEFVNMSKEILYPQIQGVTPAEALRKALRPRRSETTPPRPRGLHPAGALACTHQNKAKTEKGRSPHRKRGKSLQASTITPFEARGLLSGTIIRDTPNAPNYGW